MIDLGYNRDHAHIWFDDNNVLCSDKDYVLEYMRVGYKEDNKTVMFIDPSGGPMISVGDVVSNKKILKIESGGYGFKVVFDEILPDDVQQEEKKNYPHQVCQDKKINDNFRILHKDIVDKIITFCKENNIVIDGFSIVADGIGGSIPYGSWQACTDSCFSMYKDMWYPNTENAPYLISL